MLILILLIIPLINSQEILSFQGELLIRYNNIDKYQYFLKKYDNFIIQLSFKNNIIYDNINTWSSVRVFGNFSSDNNIFNIYDIIPLSSRSVSKYNQNNNILIYVIQKICNNKNIVKYILIENNKNIISIPYISCNGNNNWNYSSIDSYTIMNNSKIYTIKNFNINIDFFNKFIIILPYNKQYKWNIMNSIRCGTLCYSWINFNEEFLNISKIKYIMKL